jgi:hypothetical protein
VEGESVEVPVGVTGARRRTDDRRVSFVLFVASGSLEARQAFAEHVCDRPKPASSPQRRSGFGFR